MTEINSDTSLELDAIFEPAKNDDADISHRITAILDSAEAEAGRIRDRAQVEAAAIVKAAHLSAAERIEELTREPERIRDEAQRQARELVRSAEENATRQVTDAERQARETVADAEGRADLQRREMERTVAEMEASMDRRQRQLKDEIRSLAELRSEASGSVSQVVAALQGVATDLNRKLGTIPNVGPQVDEVPLPAIVDELRQSDDSKGTFRRLRRAGDA